jgi:hypothetical protein
MLNPLYLSVESESSQKVTYQHPTGLKVTLTEGQVVIEPPGRDPITLDQPPTELVQVGHLTYRGPKGAKGATTYDLVGQASGYPRQIVKNENGTWTCELFRDGRSYPSAEQLLRAFSPSTVTWWDFEWPLLRAVRAGGLF